MDRTCKYCNQIAPEEDLYVVPIIGEIVFSFYCLKCFTGEHTLDCPFYYIPKNDEEKSTLTALRQIGK